MTPVGSCPLLTALVSQATGLSSISR